MSTDIERYVDNNSSLLNNSEIRLCIYNFDIYYQSHAQRFVQMHTYRIVFNHRVRPSLATQSFKTIVNENLSISMCGQWIFRFPKTIFSLFWQNSLCVWQVLFYHSFDSLHQSQLQSIRWSVCRNTRPMQTSMPCTSRVMCNGQAATRYKEPAAAAGGRRRTNHLTKTLIIRR